MSDVRCDEKSGFFCADFVLSHCSSNFIVVFRMSGLCPLWAVSSLQFVVGRGTDYSLRPSVCYEQH